MTNALATYDRFSILQRELFEHRISANALASLADVSPSRLSAYFNGAKCPKEQQKRIEKAWTQIKCLVKLAKPLKIDFSRTIELRECISLMESGNLSIVVYAHPIATQRSILESRGRESSRRENVR